MSERTTKVLWHLFLVGVALIEYRIAKTPFRKCLIGACAGWHLAAAIHTNDSKPLTEHFSEEELGISGCEDRIIFNGQFLCSKILEPIRAHFATAVHITSGYRPPAKNTEVHGVHESEHLYDDDHSAADFQIPGVDLLHIFNWIWGASGLDFRQVILERDEQTNEPACIHISIRRNGNDKREALVGATNNSQLYHFVECV